MEGRPPGHPRCRGLALWRCATATQIRWITWFRSIVAGRTGPARRGSKVSVLDATESKAMASTPPSILSVAPGANTSRGYKAATLSRAGLMAAYCMYATHATDNYSPFTD